MRILKIEKLEQSQKEEMQRNNEEILSRFISSKEIEDCSIKTLNYYKDNLGISGVEILIRNLGREANINKVHPHKFRQNTKLVK